MAWSGGGLELGEPVGACSERFFDVFRGDSDGFDLVRGQGLEVLVGA